MNTRSVIPPAFIRLPAKMKKGTARSGKLSDIDFVIRCGITARGIPSTIN